MARSRRSATTSRSATRTGRDKNRHERAEADHRQHHEVGKETREQQGADHRPQSEGVQVGAARGLQQRVGSQGPAGATAAGTGRGPDRRAQRDGERRLRIPMRGRPAAADGQGAVPRHPPGWTERARAERARLVGTARNDRRPVVGMVGKGLQLAPARAGDAPGGAALVGRAPVRQRARRTAGPGARETHCRWCR